MPPRARLGLAHAVHPAPGGVPGRRLGEGHVQVEARGRAAVVADEVGEHGAVVPGGQDAFEDHVEAVVQGVADDQGDEADVGPARTLAAATGCRGAFGRDSVAA
jgi:hypothetical protein